MPRNLDLMTEEEQRVARDIAVLAADTLAQEHGNAEVGEAEFAISLTSLRTAIDVELASCVGALRSSGMSWSDIGSLLGMSKQAAHERFRCADGQPTASIGAAAVKRS